MVGDYGGRDGRKEGVEVNVRLDRGGGEVRYSEIFK